MKIEQDGKGQPYIEWEQSEGGYKRAWVIRREDGEHRDWAKTGRYLNVVRCNSRGHPGGNSTDFPVFNSPLSDEQLLRAFVHSVCAMTGCVLLDGGDAAEKI